MVHKQDLFTHPAHFIDKYLLRITENTKLN